MGEEEEREEELEAETNSSNQEVLVKELKQWQISYYDDVISFFQSGNKERGNIAFKRWENRFLKYLISNLPELVDEYKQGTKAPMAIATYSGEPPLNVFNRYKGNKVEAFLEQCIDDAGKGFVGKNYNQSIYISDEVVRNGSASAPRIFISHSSKDSKIANLILELFRFALNISSKEIRCTSVDGYRLSGGADVENTLKMEVLNAEVLIGLISEKSFDSAYVLFELGARWGTGKKLIPLLAPGMDANKLKGPIIGYNALSCESNSQLLQLVENIAEVLDLSLESPSSYQNKIDAILEISKTNN